MILIENREIEVILWKVIDTFLIPRFHELDMNASGEWLQSLEVQATPEGGKIRGRHYSEQLAKGREPGRMPPVAALEKWVQAKFGMSGSQATGMAWAVAKKIQKSGTSWYQKGGSDLIELLEEPQVIEFIQQELIATARLKIAENLNRNAQKIFA